MTLDPAATPGTTDPPPVDGSGTTVPPGTTDPADPAVGSVSAEEAAELRARLADEERKNAQLLSEKNNTEQARRDAENNGRRNARLDADIALLNDPGEATAEQIADARWRVSMAAVNEATARAEQAERRADDLEQRLSTSVPDKHRAAVQARMKQTGKSWNEAAEGYELEQRRAGTWDDAPANPTNPARPPAASPAQRPTGTVLRGVPPSTPPLPRQLSQSEYTGLQHTDPDRFEKLRQARKARTFTVVPG